MTLQMGIPICPITHDVMREPVIDHEGNSYEKSAILEWLKVNSTSPVSRNPLFAEQLIPNRALLEFYNSREVSTTPIQGTITNCSNCNKVMKVTNYKGHKELLCYTCRDWACKTCTFINKCTQNACEICEVIR